MPFKSFASPSTPRQGTKSAYIQLTIRYRHDADASGIKRFVELAAKVAGLVEASSEASFFSFSFPFRLGRCDKIHFPIVQFMNRGYSKVRSRGLMRGSKCTMTYAKTRDQPQHSFPLSRAITRRINSGFFFCFLTSLYPSQSSLRYHDAYQKTPRERVPKPAQKSCRRLPRRPQTRRYL